jgi:hypothetical protein
VIVRIVFLAVLVGACGKGRPVDTPVAKTIDGVLFLSPLGQSSSSTLQSSYPISSSQRLLLRFEEIESQLDMFSQSPRVSLSVRLSNAIDATEARESFRLCPLTRNWMMAATWEKAHPYRKGKWDRAGGDFNPSECVRAEDFRLKEQTDEPSFFSKDGQMIEWDCSDESRLCFDITSWFKKYVAEGEQNFGHILFSDNETAINIIGDLQVAEAPRIHWFRRDFDQPRTSSNGKRYLTPN